MQAKLTRNLSPSIHVVHTTAKWSFHVVERVKNGCEMHKNKEQNVPSVLNSCFSLSNMQICYVFVDAIVAAT